MQKGKRKKAKILNSKNLNQFRQNSESFSLFSSFILIDDTCAKTSSSFNPSLKTIKFAVQELLCNMKIEFYCFNIAGKLTEKSRR